MVTVNVNITRCTAGRCSYTFESPPNSSSSYDNVSVAAENVVGVGAARTCTAQPISELTLSLTAISCNGEEHHVTLLASFPGPAQLSESWAGPGNKAITLPVLIFSHF